MCNLISTHTYTYTFTWLKTHLEVGQDGQLSVEDVLEDLVRSMVLPRGRPNRHFLVEKVHSLDLYRQDKQSHVRSFRRHTRNRRERARNEKRVGRRRNGWGVKITTTTRFISTALEMEVTTTTGFFCCWYVSLTTAAPLRQSYSIGALKQQSTRDSLASSDCRSVPGPSR